MNERTKILIDQFEKKLFSRLSSTKQIEVCLKPSGVGYDATADIIIELPDGTRWGIERKSKMDLYNSILSKRVYKQLDKLREKYPGRSILLVESSYIPKKFWYKRSQIEQSVLTFLSEQSFYGPVLLTTGVKHTAHFIIKFARDLLKGKYKKV